MFFDYKKGNNLYMVNNIEENYPNLTWAQFAICNDNATGAFEDMARRLFCIGIFSCITAINLI